MAKIENLKAAVALHFAWYNFLPAAQDAAGYAGDGGRGRFAAGQ